MLYAWITLKNSTALIIRSYRLVYTFTSSLFVYLVRGFDANKGLSKRHGSEAAVEVEEADIGVDMQEGSHVQIVGQGG